MSINTTRRSFIGLCGAAALAAIPIRVLAQSAATAAKLGLKDPTAIALGYVENAQQLSAAKEPSFKSGSHCGNCQLYVAAQEKAGYAPCGAVGGKLVKKTAWCKAWAG